MGGMWVFCLRRSRRGPAVEDAPGGGAFRGASHAPAGAEDGRGAFGVDVVDREADGVADVAAEVEELLVEAVPLIDLLGRLLKLADGGARPHRGDDGVARVEDAAVHLLLLGREGAGDGPRARDV